MVRTTVLDLRWRTLQYCCIYIQTLWVREPGNIYLVMTRNGTIIVDHTKSRSFVLMIRFDGGELSLQNFTMRDRRAARYGGSKDAEIKLYGIIQPGEWRCVNSNWDAVEVCNGGWLSMSDCEIGYAGCEVCVLEHNNVLCEHIS